MILEIVSNKVSPCARTLSAQDAFRVGLWTFILIHLLDPWTIQSGEGGFQKGCGWEQNLFVISRCDPPARVSNFKFEKLPAALGPSPYRLPRWPHLIWFSSTVVQPHTRPSETVTSVPPQSDAICSPLPLCADEDIVIVINAAAVALVVSSVDEVVVLVSRRAGRCHAFLVVVVRRRVRRCHRRRRRRLRGMSLSLPPLRLSLPGGAVASVDEVVVLVVRHGGRCYAFLVVVVRWRVLRRRRCRQGMSSSLLPPRLSLQGGACAAVIPPPKIVILWLCACPPRTAPAGGRNLTVVSAGGGVCEITRTKYKEK